MAAMVEPAIDELAAFRTWLNQHAADYQLLGNLPDSKAEVRFIGTFQGQEILWHMTLFTLPRYWRERAGALASHAANLSVRGVLDLRLKEGRAPDLRVALNVPIIDEPVVRKAIILVRNYRRLREGVQVWGEA